MHVRSCSNKDSKYRAFSYEGTKNEEQNETKHDQWVEIPLLFLKFLSRPVTHPESNSERANGWQQ
jgi:hypothetical protein